MFRRAWFSRLSFTARWQGWHSNHIDSAHTPRVTNKQDPAGYDFGGEGQHSTKTVVMSTTEGIWSCSVKRLLGPQAKSFGMPSFLVISSDVFRLSACQRRFLSAEQGVHEKKQTIIEKQKASIDELKITLSKLETDLGGRQAKLDKLKETQAELKGTFGKLVASLAGLHGEFDVPREDRKVLRTDLKEMESVMQTVAIGKQLPVDEQAFGKHFASSQLTIQQGEMSLQVSRIDKKEADICAQQKRMDQEKADIRSLEAEIAAVKVEIFSMEPK
jgi:hypothetical protein